MTDVSTDAVDDASSDIARERTVDSLLETGVLMIRLNRPRKRNAITMEMLEDMLELLGRLRDGSPVRAVVLTGAGEAFAAGADIRGYAEGNEVSFRRFTALANEVCDRLDQAPVPVIAAVRGPALGGGFELVMSCDLVVAEPNATFGLPELSLGLIPGWGGTQRATRTLGRHRAAHLILTGSRLTAEEAKRIGVVTQLCSSGSAEQEALSIARTLATGPREAITAALRTLAAADATTSHAMPGFELEQAELRLLYDSRDGREGIAAFMEKRTPIFGTSRSADSSTGKESGTT